MSRHKYANIDVTVDQVTPLYDNLLVRRIDESHDGLVLPSDFTVAKDGSWVKTPDHGPRKGIVVAMGRGDIRTKGWYVEHAAVNMTGEAVYGILPHALMDRKPMDVKVGDTIIYPRFESSHVLIGGEMMTFVHEADVMAVLEPEPQVQVIVEKRDGAIAVRVLPCQTV